jgi:hypothetical protein
MSTDKQSSTERLIARLKADSKKEDELELIRRAVQGDELAGAFVLDSLDKVTKKAKKSAASMQANQG